MFVWFCIFWLSTASPVIDCANNPLLAHWTFDEGTGKVAHDYGPTQAYPMHLQTRDRWLRPSDDATRDDTKGHGVRQGSGALNAGLRNPPMEVGIPIPARFSISFWLFQYTEPSGTGPSIVTLLDAARNPTYTLTLSDSGEPTWAATGGGGSTSTSVYTSEAWHHFVATSDSLYHNGQLVGTFDAGIAGLGSHLVLGHDPTPQSADVAEWWIDDLRVYSTDLSAEQVQSVYDYTAPLCAATMLSLAQPSAVLDLPASRAAYVTIAPEVTENWGTAQEVAIVIRVCKGSLGAFGYSRNAENHYTVHAPPERPITAFCFMVSDSATAQYDWDAVGEPPSAAREERRAQILCQGMLDRYAIIETDQPAQGVFSFSVDAFPELTTVEVSLHWSSAPLASLVTLKLPREELEIDCDNDLLTSASWPIPKWTNDSECEGCVYQNYVADSIDVARAGYNMDLVCGLRGAGTPLGTVFGAPVLPAGSIPTLNQVGIFRFSVEATSPDGIKGIAAELTCNHIVRGAYEFLQPAFSLDEIIDDAPPPSPTPAESTVGTVTGPASMDGGLIALLISLAVLLCCFVGLIILVLVRRRNKKDDTAFNAIPAGPAKVVPDRIANRGPPPPAPAPTAAPAQVRSPPPMARSPPPQARGPPPQARSAPQQTLAKAKFKWEGEGENDLPFAKGDILQILSQEVSDGPDWWKAASGARQGLVPKKFFFPVYTASEDEPEETDGDTGTDPTDQTTLL